MRYHCTLTAINKIFSKLTVHEFDEAGREVSTFSARILGCWIFSEKDGIITRETAVGTFADELKEYSKLTEFSFSAPEFKKRTELDPNLRPAAFLDGRDDDFLYLWLRDDIVQYKAGPYHKKGKTEDRSAIVGREESFGLWDIKETRVRVFYYQYADRLKGRMNEIFSQGYNDVPMTYEALGELQAQMGQVLRALSAFISFWDNASTDEILAFYKKCSPGVVDEDKILQLLASN